MEISYSKCGDYLLPNLVLEEAEEKPIGKYGRIHKRYLKENRPALYSSLLLTGELDQPLAEIDEACEARMDLLIICSRVGAG